MIAGIQKTTDHTLLANNLVGPVDEESLANFSRISFKKNLAQSNITFLFVVKKIVSQGLIILTHYLNPQLNIYQSQLKQL